jgi:hypothetical protein
MLRAIFLTFALVAVSLLSFAKVSAQSDEKKFEVGAQFSVLQAPTRTLTNSALGTTSENHATEYGFGGRIGYNLSRNFALEAEGNFFPRDRDVQGGQKIQGLFGVKAGKKFDKVGVFAKARPGFIRFEKGDYRFGPGGCILIFPPPLACFQPVAKTNFAFDVGGIIELYPSARTIIRFDAGDTIIRFGARTVAASNPALPPPAGLVAIPRAAETKHNFQGSVGVGFRF